MKLPSDAENTSRSLPVSRRAFLRLLAAGAIASLAAILFKIPPQSVTDTQTNLTTTRATETVGTTSTTHQTSKVSKVVVVRGTSGAKPQALVEKALELLGGLDKLAPTQTSILVKPNVGFYDKEATTNPEVTAAVIGALKRIKATKIIVGESAVRSTDTEHALDRTGTKSQAEAAGAEVRDLGKDPIVKIDLPEGMAIKSVEIFETVRECSYLIDVPRIKRHSATTVTISLKNMMGIIPDKEKGRFHRTNLNQCIADLNSVIRPNLVIIDGTKVMTKRGPTGGVMVALNLVIASTDPVAADLVAAEELFKAEGSTEPRESADRIEHICRAGDLGIGVTDRSKIEIVDVVLP